MHLKTTDREAAKRPKFIRMLAQKALSILKVLLTIYFKNITKHFYRLATKNWWLSDIKTLYLSHIYKLAFMHKKQEEAENP